MNFETLKREFENLVGIKPRSKPLEKITYNRLKNKKYQVKIKKNHFRNQKIKKIKYFLSDLPSLVKH